MEKHIRKVKKELGAIFISSDGRMFLKELDAIYAQSELDNCNYNKMKKREYIMKIVDLVMNLLKDENWGVYYKSLPMQPLEMQDGNPLYKINQVEECDVEEAIIKKLKEDTSWNHSQTNLNQKKT